MSAEVASSLSVLLYPDPRLRVRAGPVPADPELVRATTRQLFELMYRNQGRGFAAPQAGLPWRLFVINPTGDPEQQGQEKVFINPEILVSKPRRAVDEEGCLSLPGLYALVERPRTVKVRYHDLDGKRREAAYDGTYARIFQHEFDHLDGILFIDRLTPADLEQARPALTEFERQAASDQHA